MAGYITALERSCKRGNWERKTYVKGMSSQVWQSRRRLAHKGRQPLHRRHCLAVRLRKLETRTCRVLGLAIQPEVGDGDRERRRHGCDTRRAWGGAPVHAVYGCPPRVALDQSQERHRDAVPLERRWWGCGGRGMREDVVVCSDEGGFDLRYRVLAQSAYGCG
jgi:hypothetical protein